MICWRNLRLSTKIVKIYGIEYHLLGKKNDGIGYFIEDFIEQTNQFGMLDEKRNSKYEIQSKNII